MPKYTLDDLDDLEEAAAHAKPVEQSRALREVTKVLEQEFISYAVIGGMDFYLRGSGRTTSDVHIAVNDSPRMDALLGLFDPDPNIFLPATKMQWLAGVARIFVKVDGRTVQIDLLTTGS
ncbi:hypothetical protein N3K66_000048 [Trichothecium roseum]|uniref:Uncharacterized protein n=1 Tax=Trichothecium roseum TaxID=47278 RepID=A0ACC0VAU9_9HYPO|nr:hypothetical protein N3K66_000048 [Trichothecium roseum]